jgi:hypothetical protein
LKRRIRHKVFFVALLLGLRVVAFGNGVVNDADTSTHITSARDMWDSLEKKDEKGFFQTSFKYCNILVISILCNDPKYDLRKEESLEIYKNYFPRGLPVKTELEACEKIIKYFEEHNI